VTNYLPAPHPNPRVDQIRPYVTDVVFALVDHGVDVRASWLDPQNPTDATIIYAHATAPCPMALVWDEDTGWRRGEFVSGKQGQRTVLAHIERLGGEARTDPKDVARWMTPESSDQQLSLASHTPVRR
jgi:hypothetical protein